MFKLTKVLMTLALVFSTSAFAAEGNNEEKGGNKNKNTERVKNRKSKGGPCEVCKEEGKEGKEGKRDNRGQSKKQHREFFESLKGKSANDIALALIDFCKARHAEKLAKIAEMQAKRKKFADKKGVDEEAMAKRKANHETMQAFMNDAHEGMVALLTKLSKQSGLTKKELHSEIKEYKATTKAAREALMAKLGIDGKKGKSPRNKSKRGGKCEHRGKPGENGMHKGEHKGSRGDKGGRKGNCENAPE